jgi:hypothetical protein
MNGNLIGTVFSSSPKHPLANVTVTATLLTTGAPKVVLTDNTGSYRIAVPPGIYQLSFTAVGYRSFASGDIRLTPGETVRTDAELEPSGLG